MVRTKCVVTEPPPTAEKRSPGASGKATRAKKKSASVGSKQAKINTLPRRRQELDRDLAFYDGRIRLATIMYRERTFIVVLPSGILLGAFSTLKQARAEVSAAHGGGQ